MSAATPHLLPALSALPPKLPPTFSPFFPNPHHKINSFSLSYPISFQFSPVANGRTGSANFASNNHRISNSINNEEEEVKRVEKSMLIMPLDEMQSWFENRPAGFGEGKIYDTSVEDKIEEEMEQTRRAQLANINKLKHTSPQKIATMKKKEMEMQKAVEAVQCGVEVRIGNLPKKRNIHRDLQSAFKGFPGILHISPAVSGNKKTRDPICKGFAFIYLESKKVADSFVQMYTNQTVQFGRIQKHITCEMTNSQRSSESASEQSAVSTSVSAAQLEAADMGEGTDADSYVDSLTWDSEEEMFSEWSAMGTFDGTGTSNNVEDGPMVSDTEVIDVGTEDFNISGQNKNDEGRVRNEGDNAIANSTSLRQSKNEVAQNPQNKAKSEAGTSTEIIYNMDDGSMFADTVVIDGSTEDVNISGPKKKNERRPSNEAINAIANSTSLKQAKNRVAQKQQKKANSGKNLRLNVPGAAKRLKIKEKAVLAGVFSKYGGKAD